MSLPSGVPDPFERNLDLPDRRTLSLPRWIGPLAALCAVGLVPWICYLANALPRHARAAHYDVAWVGFDVGVCVVLATLAVAALRSTPATGPLSAVAATLLVVDAWFDVVTSGPGQLAMAVASAVLLELPLALLCAWAAVNAERVRARAYRRLWQHAEHAMRVARQLAARERQSSWQDSSRSDGSE